MNRSPIRQPPPRRRPRHPHPTLATAPITPLARSPLLTPASACPIRWPDCNSNCQTHPTALELAARLSAPSLRSAYPPVLVELLTIALDDLAVYTTLVANPAIPSWAFSTLLSQLNDYDYQSVTLSDIDQRFSAILRSPRTKKAELRRLARITSVSDLALLELLTHRACDPTVTAVTALTLARNDSPHALTLRTTVRQFGTDTARACLVMARFEAPLPSHTDQKTLIYRTRALITTSNKLLNRFNHCRPLALEVLESLIEGWSGTAQDLTDVTVTLLGPKHPHPA